MEDTAPLQDDNQEGKPEKELSGELEKVLAEIVKESETDENLEKLAQKLSDEWSKQADSAEKPDLSLSKFRDKLKNFKP